MYIKGLVDEDFVNYKKPSMFISFPKCSFKCDKECSMQVCQNSTLALSQNINIDTSRLVERYLDNPITHAIVCGGLEPIDTFDELLEFISVLRKNTEDDVVIYTGYYKNEILDKVKELSKFKNVIIKFGRFIPNQEKHFDEVLGVYLASNNQYSERIS